MKKVLLTIILLLFVVSLASAFPEPQVQVKTMVDSVLSVMTDSSLSSAAKKERISGRVQEFLSVDKMSRYTLGNYWEEASPEQRSKFSALFVKVLENTYLNRIDDYSDGSVKYLNQRVKEDKAIIDTIIVSEELEIPVQYKMIYSDGSWQVVDLVIEGVSLVRNYRSSYGEIIRRDGFDGLFALMESKIQES